MFFKVMFKSGLLSILATIVPLSVATLLAQPKPSPEADLLFENRPAAFGNAIQEALAKNDPAQAYLHARAWKRIAPGEIAPLTSLATIYLAFDAPAAALDTLDEALVLGPDDDETRRILALRIQALAELRDSAATWANARAYLRSAEPGDAFAPVVTQMQWLAFGPLARMSPSAALTKRLAGTSARAPLTTVTIRDHSATLTPALYEACNQAIQSENAEAIARATRDFARYLLTAHYVADPERPGSSLTPISTYPDSLYILREMTAGDKPDAIALSLLQWAPQRPEPRFTFAGGTDENEDIEANGKDPRQDIETYLKTVATTWADLQKKLPGLLQAADAAQTASSIEDSLRELLSFQISQLRPLEAMIVHHTDRLNAWQNRQPAPISNSPLNQQLDGWINTLTSAPLILELQRRLDPALPDISPDAKALAVSLPYRLAQLFFAEADTAWTAPLRAIAQNPTSRLEDFDLLIARDLMTPELWARRLAVAEQQGDWSEIAWSGCETHANEPRALAAWLAPIIAENDALIDRALKALADGTDEEKSQALVDLKTGLARDPGHFAALRILYQHFLDLNQDAYAAGVLEMLWRLNPADFTVEDDALALAARAGHWRLLLSLADYRLARSDTDLAAHLHRQIAAVALGLGGLAADSTPALDGTVYMHQARVLHSMAFDLKNQKYEFFNNSLTGLTATVKELDFNHSDPVIRLWLALGLKINQSAFSTGGTKWENLGANAAPEMKAHLAFIRGDTKPDDYLAAFRGTADEGIALFLHQFLATQSLQSQLNQYALADLASRTDLPLLFRAKAAAARYIALTPLRASDPFYTASSTSNWDEVWSSLAPGQLLAALGEVKLPKAPATLPILRLTRPLRNPLVALDNTPNYSGRLWELDGVQVTARNKYNNRWTIEQGQLVALTHSSLAGRELRGEGSLWMESSDMTAVTGTLGQLVQVDVSAYNNALAVTRRWEALRLRAEEYTFRLGAAKADAPQANGRVVDALFVSHQSVPFNLLRDSALQIEDTRFYTPKPLGLTAGQGIFKNSRVTGAAQPALAAPIGLQITPLNLTGPADRTVSTAADLRQALGAALPGQRIDVAPGRILLDDGPIQVPHGVLLRGSTDSKNPTVLSVTPSSPTNPLVIINRGDSWIENLTLDVEISYTTGPGRKLALADTNGYRKALVANRDARPLLRNVSFESWARDDASRPAIVAEGAQVAINGRAPGTLQLAGNGRIDYIGHGPNSPIHLSGKGNAHFPNAAAVRYTIAGKDITFHGASSQPASLIYRDGAGDPRTLAWRSLARQNFVDTLDQLKAGLPGQLAAAGGTEARIEVIRAAAKRLGPLVRAAQLSSQETIKELAPRLNPVLTSRPDEFPFYMEVLHFRSRAFPTGSNLYIAHSQTFTPALRDRLKAHLNALVGSQHRRNGEFTSADRTNLMTFMSRYPVGSPNHARAMAAFNRGESAATFIATLNAEAAAKRRAAEYEARLAKQRQAEYERQLQAARTPPAPAKPTWWETYSAENPGGRYNSPSYTPGSANQQMRNYVRELDKKIYNQGRDYGKMRVY